MSRSAFLALLRDQPGLAPAAAARALGVSPSTALYHLRRLVREGAVVAQPPERRPRYFAAGTIPRDERARMLACHGATALLAAVRDAPGASKSELARRLAIARATLSWQLARLERAGLVRYEKEGRSVRVYPGEALS